MMFLFVHRGRELFSSSNSCTESTRLLIQRKTRMLRSLTTFTFITRRYSTKPTSLFSLFPKTFSKPQFTVNDRSLRKEYRSLQQQSHPDLTQDDTQSSLLNKAYITLKSPLTRAQYLLELHGIDLTNETGTQEYTDQATLFDVLDIHESLESIDDEEELTKYKQENDERIKESVKKLEELFGSEQWDQAARECIKLKYWMNIDNAVKNWDGGVSPLIH